MSFETTDANVRNVQHPTPAAFSPFMAVVLDAMTTPDLCDTPANLHCHIITFQEHTPMSIEMLKWHILAAHGRGIPAIVRVPGPNNHVGRSAGLWGADIKHALDGGADGVVVPMVRSADEVRAIVADCRYPTGGGRPPPFDHPGTDTRRGFGPVTPMVYGHAELYSYLARADRNVFVAVMIETVCFRECTFELQGCSGHAHFFFASHAHFCFRESILKSAPRCPRSSFNNSVRVHSAG